VVDAKILSCFSSLFRQVPSLCLTVRIFSHSPWLVIIFGHHIPNIFRRHLLTKTCSFCIILFVTTIQKDRFDIGIKQRRSLVFSILIFRPTR
jgi:hypothetical protein